MVSHQRGAAAGELQMITSLIILAYIAAIAIFTIAIVYFVIATHKSNDE